MSIRRETPCDFGPCPYDYDVIGHHDCEWYCGAEEPADDPEIWEEEEE